MPTGTVSQDELHLDVHETELLLTIHFRGASEARDPAEFLAPVLAQAAERATFHRKPLVLDFRKLERMNSATVGVIVRTFDEARRGTVQIRVIYDGKVRWQRLCFGTLIAYDTPSHRIHLAAL